MLSSPGEYVNCEICQGTPFILGRSARTAYIWWRCVKKKKNGAADRLFWLARTGEYAPRRTWSWEAKDSTHTLVQLCGQPWVSVVIYLQEDSLTDWKIRENLSENRPRVGFLEWKIEWSRAWIKQPARQDREKYSCLFSIPSLLEQHSYVYCLHKHNHAQPIQ